MKKKMTKNKMTEEDKETEKTAGEEQLESVVALIKESQEEAAALLKKAQKEEAARLKKAQEDAKKAQEEAKKAQEESEDAMLDELFTGDIERKLFGGTEETGWAKPGYDPVKRIAAVFEKEERKHKPSALGFDPLSNILASYLIRQGNISAVRNILSKDKKIPAQDIAGMLVALESLKQYGAVQSDKISSFADYMNAAGALFGERLQKLFALDMKDTKTVAVKYEKAKAVKKTDEHVAEKYQEPMFDGFTPEALIAANVCYGLLDGCKERIRSVGSAEELAKLAFLSQCAGLLKGKEAASLKDAILNKKEDLGGLVLDTLVGFAIKNSKELAKIGAEEVIAKYQQVLKSRFGYSQDLARQLSEVKGISFDYTGIAEYIRKQLEDKRGLFFKIPRIGNSAKEFEAFKQDILNLRLKFYEIIPPKDGKDLKNKDLDVGDVVMTCKALKGDTYFGGTRIGELPIGTIGTIENPDYGGKCCFITPGGHYHLKPEELQKVKTKEIKMPEMPANGRKAEIIHDEAYATSKKGSWGDIIEEQDDKYLIRFKYLAREHHGFAEWWIAKKDVKVTDIDDEAIRKEKEKVDKETKGLLTDIESIVKTAEAEVERAVAKKKELIDSGIQTFKAMGIDERIIRIFFDRYLERESVAELVDAGMLSRETVFDEIKKARSEINYSSLADSIMHGIQEKMGVFVLQGKVRNADDSYAKFKRELAENVLKGFKTPKEQKTKNFRRDEPVMLLEPHGEISAGTVGTYMENGYYDKNARVVKFPQYDAVEIKVKLGNLEPAFEIPEMPSTELKAGARVKIRRDSEYAHQTDGVGTLQQDYQANYVDEHVRVVFDDDYRNGYRKIDLEPANPVDPKDPKYKEIIEKIEATKQMVNNQLDLIIASAEAEQEGKKKRVDELLGNCVDTLMSIGFDDAAMKQVFEQYLGDVSYLKERGMITG